jgi:hypothetical protein
MEMQGRHPGNKSVNICYFSSPIGLPKFYIRIVRHRSSMRNSDNNKRKISCNVSHSVYSIDIRLL